MHIKSGKKARKTFRYHTGMLCQLIEVFLKIFRGNKSFSSPVCDGFLRFSFSAIPADLLISQHCTAGWAFLIHPLFQALGTPGLGIQCVAKQSFCIHEPDWQLRFRSQVIMHIFTMASSFFKIQQITFLSGNSLQKWSTSDCKRPRKKDTRQKISQETRGNLFFLLFSWEDHSVCSWVLCYWGDQVQCIKFQNKLWCSYTVSTIR